MKHILTTQRRHKERSLNMIVDRLNVAYRFLGDHYSEKLDGRDTAERVLLRDAILEGFLLGLQWAVGGRDELSQMMMHKAEISSYLNDNLGFYART